MILSTQSQTLSPDEFTIHVNQMTPTEWNEIVSLFEDASFYQTWAYGSVSWGEAALSHLVVRRHGEVVAAAQFRMARVPVLRRGIAYLRWGPMWRRHALEPDEAVLRTFIHAAVREYVGRQRLLIRVLPCAFEQDASAQDLVDAWKEADFKTNTAVRVYRTIRVDLTSSLEAIRKRLHQKWRNQLNASERKGLVVVEGTGDELFERFLAIYDDMMRRKQFSTTADPRDFAAMQRQLPSSQKMIVMLAENEGDPVAGLVSTAVGEMGIYLHGATSDAGMKCKGSYLLQWRMMQALKERGCRWYDLGGINPEENPGVYHFKSGMGGEEIAGVGGLSRRADLLSTLSVQAGERLRDLSRALKQKLLRPASGGAGKLAGR